MTKIHLHTFIMKCCTVFTTGRPTQIITLHPAELEARERLT